MARLHVGLFLVALTFSVGGCKKETPPAAPTSVPTPAPQTQAPAPVALTVTNISLGKALGSDKKVTAATDTFAKGDTIYAVVETSGSGNATLKAKWTYHKGDKTASVDESAQRVIASGPSSSEFHVSKPDGWPSGDYKVEIFLDDKSVGMKTFTVK